MIALGCDVVSVERIATAVARHGDRFLDRCFRAGERALAASRGEERDAALAARWAAKEAFVKALGPGADGVPYHDVEVIGGGDAPPILRLHGRAAAALAQTGAVHVGFSLARTRWEAVAVVVLSA